MSLEGINNLDTEWFLNNTLTINNNVIVDGDITTTGFIYDGGVPLDYLNTNNTWTGKNTYTNDLPTFIDPTTDAQMATKNYLDGAVVGLGNSLLSSNNTWTANNAMTSLPTILGTATTTQLLNKSTTDNNINADTGNLSSVNTWTEQNTFNNTLTNNFYTPAGNNNTLVTQGYIQNELINFQPNNQLNFFRYDFGASGTRNFTCSPNTYSGCLVVMCAQGGRGVIPEPPTPHVPTTGLQSFGRAGGFAAFKLPAWSGNATLVYTSSSYTGTIGSAIFSLPNNVEVCTVLNGGWGSSNQFGGTAIFTAPFTSGQSVTGLDFVPIPPNPSMLYTYNPCVWNGLALGGSYNDATGIQVVPTGGGCCLFYFPKTTPI
jgi:hypothetical protein